MTSASIFQNVRLPLLAKGSMLFYLFFFLPLCRPGRRPTAHLMAADPFIGLTRGFTHLLGQQRLALSWSAQGSIFFTWEAVAEPGPRMCMSP